ncbi:MAG: TIM barrel protein [Planctomycetota bacterium]
MRIPRRALLQGAAAAAATPSHLAQTATETAQEAGKEIGPAKSGVTPRFGLNYAPHFGMFKAHAGDDLGDQLRFMADEGFPALEDNWLGRRPPEKQEEIARTLNELGMAMGVFVAHAEFRKPTFGLPPAEARPLIEEDMRNAVETAKRVGARWCTVVPGAIQPRLELDYQMANAVDNLRFAADILEAGNLCAVLEPLNPWRDHPGLLLTKVPQAYAICRGVNSPSVKILDDLYHQQITEGNLTGNMDLAWSEIAYIQVGDHPGRKEPGTGEINYRHLFRHLKKKGFDGIVGMEHGNAGPGKEGERALIDAYVRADG